MVHVICRITGIAFACLLFAFAQTAESVVASSTYSPVVSTAQPTCCGSI